jgi:putative membrane protein
MGVYQGPCMAFGWWWPFPLLMIVFCILLMFMMRRRMPGMMGSTMGPTSVGPKPDTRPIGPTDSARDILDKRYALGEISREEYENKKEDLRGP